MNLICQLTFCKLVDCENSGDFQSITDSVVRSRGKRFINEFSYPEEKPQAPPIMADSNMASKIADEERLEGLEETVEALADQVSLLLSEVRNEGCYA